MNKLDILSRLGAMLGAEGDGERHTPISRTVPMTKDMKEAWKAIQKESEELSDEVVETYRRLYEKVQKYDYRRARFWVEVKAELKEFGDLSIDDKRGVVNIHEDLFGKFASDKKPRAKNLMSLMDLDDEK
jgi:hypothetical protein